MVITGRCAIGESRLQTPHGFVWRSAPQPQRLGAVRSGCDVADGHSKFFPTLKGLLARLLFEAGSSAEVLSLSTQNNGLLAESSLAECSL